MSLRLVWIMCLLCLWLVPLRAEDGYITALSYNKDGDRLAVGDSMGRLAVYEVEGSLVGTRLFVEQRFNPITSLEWHPFNNDLLLITTFDSVLTVDVSQQDVTGRTAFASMIEAAWSADGTHILATNAPDRIFYQTDILDYPSFETIGVSATGPIWSSQFDPTRTRRVISKTGNYPATLVVDQKGEVLHTFTFPTDLVLSDSHIDWANGVIALGDSSYLGVYDENSYAPLWIDEFYESLTGANDILDLSLRPGTTQIALRGRRTIRIFDWASQRDVVTIPIPEDEFSHIAWSRDGRSLAISTGNNLSIQEMPSIEGGVPAPTQVFYRIEDDRDCGISAGPMGILSTDEAPEDKDLKICFAPYDGLVFQFVNTRQELSADMTIAPLVERSVIIDGHGAIIGRASSEPLYRFFAVAPGGHLTLRNLTLRGGLIDGGKGAAILNQGTLTLDNVTFEYNCIVDDPCDDEDAIYNDGGTVEVVGSVSYSAILLTTLPPTPTPTPTITPVVLDKLTPVLLPTFAPTPTP